MTRSDVPEGGLTLLACLLLCFLIPIPYRCQPPYLGLAVVAVAAFLVMCLAFATHGDPLRYEDLPAHINFLTLAAAVAFSLVGTPHQTQLVSAALPFRYRACLLNLAAYLFLWEFFLVSAARRLYRLRRAFVETAMSARNEALWRELHSGFLAPEEFETKQAHLRKEDQFYLRLSYAVSLLVAQGLGAAVLFVAYGLPPTGLLWANFGILVTLSISAGLLAFSLSREDVLG